MNSVILPIAFSYEQIAEEKSYAKELSGKSKQKESVSGVLNTENSLKKAMVKSTAANGEPIYLNEIIANFDGHWDDMEEAVQNISKLPRRSCTVIAKTC